jgi:hypothetical protein
MGFIIFLLVIAVGIFLGIFIFLVWAFGSYGKITNTEI